MRSYFFNARNERIVRGLCTQTLVHNTQGGKVSWDNPILDVFDTIRLESVVVFMYIYILI